MLTFGSLPPTCHVIIYLANIVLMSAPNVVNSTICRRENIPAQNVVCHWYGMPTKRTFIWPIDVDGNPTRPMLVTKTEWQSFSEKADWFGGMWVVNAGQLVCVKNFPKNP